MIQVKSDERVPSVFRQTRDVTYTTALVSQRESPEAVSSRACCELASRICSGDLLAERELVRVFEPSLRRHLRKKIRDQDTADDILQDCFLIVICKLRSNRVRDTSRLHGFIYGVARMLMLTNSRRTRNILPGPVVDDCAGEDTTPEDAYERNESLARVLRIVQTLPSDRDRQILERYYLLGESSELIRKDMCLSAGGFRLALHRARRRAQNATQSACPDFCGRGHTMREAARYGRKQDQCNNAPPCAAMGRPAIGIGPRAQGPLGTSSHLEILLECRRHDSNAHPEERRERQQHEIRIDDERRREVERPAANTEGLSRPLL
jgi:RNA polymerase sigma factor (sigma-70 family)